MVCGAACSGPAAIRSERTTLSFTCSAVYSTRLLGASAALGASTLGASLVAQGKESAESLGGFEAAGKPGRLSWVRFKLAAFLESTTVELSTLAAVLVYGLIVLTDLGLSGLRVPTWSAMVAVLDIAFISFFTPTSSTSRTFFLSNSPTF